MFEASEEDRFPPEILAALSDAELIENLDSISSFVVTQVQEEIDRRAQALVEVVPEPAPAPIGQFLTPEDLQFHVALFHQAVEGESQALVDLEARLGAAIQVVAALLAEARVDLFAAIDTLESALQVAADARSVQFDELESTVVTTLTEIQNRQDSLDADAEDTAGLSFFGLARAIGGFIRSPFDWFIERAADAILGEVRDGLNR